LKILILGSEGFIGSHCVSHFLESNHNIFGVDLFEQPSMQYKYRKVSRLSFEIETIISENDFDLIINASGSGNVGLSMNHPLIDFESNCLGLIKVLDAIRKFKPKAKFIHLSSAAVYGNPKELPIKETDELKPLSAYGWHKLISENLCKEYVQLYGLNISILRPFSVYGRGLKKQIFWDVYKKLSENNITLELMGTGKESRDFIHIEDLIKVIELVAFNAPMPGDIYNVASGNETTIEKAINIFIKNLGFKTELIFNNQVRKGDPLNWCADISNIQNVGFENPILLDHGLSDVSTWIKQFIAL
jgi:nucleoside-diphosphate-sugar epimerase